MSHIVSGVKILSEIQSSVQEQGSATHGTLTISSHPYVELANFEVIFNRLDNQVSQVSLEFGESTRGTYHWADHVLIDR